MTKLKKLGVWMDYSEARVMELNFNQIETKIINSGSSVVEKQDVISDDRKETHQNRSQIQHDYYNRIGDIIKNYESVILFGPTDAKLEFLHSIKVSPEFSKIKIGVKKTEKM